MTNAAAECFVAGRSIDARAADAYRTTNFDWNAEFKELADMVTV